VGKLVILLCSIFLGAHFFLSANTSIYKCPLSVSSHLTDLFFIRSTIRWAAATTILLCLPLIEATAGLTWKRTVQGFTLD